MTEKTASPPTVAPGAVVSQLFQDGNAAGARGDFSSAETCFRKLLALEPAHARASHLLANILLQANRRAEAESVLVNAAARGALPESLRLLGEIFETSGRDKPAAQCYRALLKLEPNDYVSLMKLGGLSNKLGDNAAEIDCYERAMSARPNDVDATFRFSDAAWRKDPERVVRALDALLASCGDNVERRIAVLGFSFQRKEWWERIRRGEMPYHCARIDELFFNYAIEDAKEFARLSAILMEAHPDNVSVRRNAGNAKFALGDRHGAEALWQPETMEGSIWENVRFAPAFYDELRAFTDADIARGLPPVQILAPPQPSDGSLYLSCNATYFHAFALPMIVSLHKRSPHTPAHIHIMDISDQDAAHALALLKALDPKKYSLSIERPGFAKVTMAARGYYHAIRLIRFYDHLRTYGSPLWLMDVDAVINRDLSDLFATLVSHDVAMRIRPGRMEAWNQFNACVIGASTSATSLEYFRLMAAYIAYFYQRDKLRWGIDQLAMYGVYMDVRDRAEAPSLMLLGEREVDYDYRDDGFVWCNSGVVKFKHLQRIANPAANVPEDASRSKFTQVFEEYWKTTQQLSQTARP